MNQKIFTLIRNEWRSNLWLCVEMLIVSVVLWFIVDQFHVTYMLDKRPTGFDTEHCYRIKLNEVDPKSPEFRNVESDEEYLNQRLDLLKRLQRRPEIEAASFSMNAHPYNFSNSGGSYTVDTLTATGYCMRRVVTPDFVRVFRYRGINGETPEQLAELLEQGKVLVSDNLMSFDYKDMQSMAPLVGRSIYENYDSLETKEIGTVIRPVLYSDHMQGQMNRSVVIPELWAYQGNELCVRVRENMDHGFAEKLMADAGKQLRVGNMYISGVESFDSIREKYMYSDSLQLAMMLTGMGFVLINIFLGLLGTFWFRTQQRVRDLAIRKVSGATRRQVFALLIGEGLLLLSVVTPLALLIDANLAHLELNAYYEGGFLSWDRILLCGGLSYLLMALMICFGISIPARRAMRIAPAEALRDE